MTFVTHQNSLSCFQGLESIMIISYSTIIKRLHHMIEHIINILVKCSWFSPVIQCFHSQKRINIFLLLRVDSQVGRDGRLPYLSMGSRWKGKIAGIALDASCPIASLLASSYHISWTRSTCYRLGLTLPKLSLFVL